MTFFLIVTGAIVCTIIGFIYLIGRLMYRAGDALVSEVELNREVRKQLSQCSKNVINERLSHPIEELRTMSRHLHN